MSIDLDQGDLLLFITTNNGVIAILCCHRADVRRGPSLRMTHRLRAFQNLLHPGSLNHAKEWLWKAFTRA